MILGCSGASAVLFGVIIGCVGTVMGFLGRRNQEFGVYAVVGLILSVIGVVVSVYFMDLGCPVVSLSALKETGINEVVDEAVKMAESGKLPVPAHTFSKSVEHDDGDILFVQTGKQLQHRFPAGRVQA